MTGNLAPRILSDEFGLELIRLKVNHGDVLVLRFGGQPTMQQIHEATTALRNALYGLNIDDTFTLALAGDTSLEALDEAAMAEHGWVRSLPAQ